MECEIEKATVKMFVKNILVYTCIKYDIYIKYNIHEGGSLKFSESLNGILNQAIFNI